MSTTINMEAIDATTINMDAIDVCIEISNELLEQNDTTTKQKVHRYVKLIYFNQTHLV